MSILVIFAELRARLRAVAGPLCIAVVCNVVGAEATLPLTVVRDVALPGNTARFDYESFDAQRHLLFIAHLGNSEVLAFDTQAERVVARIGDVRHVHGVLAIPDLRRVYASATGTNEVVAIDEKRMAIVARTPGGTYPDGMAYAPEAHKLYVSDELGETDTVIDVRTHQRVATISLGGEVGNTQYDPVSKHIFVNVQSRRQLVEIDPGTDQVIARNELPGAQGNHGLLIESEKRLAFIACEDDDKLLVFNLRTRQITNALGVGKEPDVLAYDAELGRLYVASESGITSIFKVDSDQVSKLAEGVVGPNAHVVAVDLNTHRLYFPIRNLDGRPVLRITEPHR